MRIKFQIITVVAIVLVCSACNFSRTANKVAAFERFVQKVEKNAANYSTEDWDKADVAFKDFVENKLNKNNNNFTSEEMRKIGELEARYYKVRIKYAGEGVLDKLKKELEYLIGFGEEIISEF